MSQQLAHFSIAQTNGDPDALAQVMSHRGGAVSDRKEARLDAVHWFTEQIDVAEAKRA